MGIDEARAMIGNSIARYRSPTPVGASEIRRFALAIMDSNPLWHDRDAAMNAGWPDIVAPPTFVLAGARPGVGDEEPAFDGTQAMTVPGVQELPLPPGRVLNAGSDLWLSRPVFPSDWIESTTRLLDVVEKSGRSGQFLLVETESTFSSGKSTLGTNRQTMILR